MKPFHSSILLLSLSSLCSVAFALPDAGEILRQQQRLQPHVQSTPAAVNVLISPDPIVPTAQYDGRLEVREFRFVGDLVELGDKELPSVVQHHVGEVLSIDSLHRVADEVTDYLRDKGYSLAHAYVGQQDFRRGVVQIMVLLGRIESDARGSGIVIRDAAAASPAQAGLRIDTERVRKTLATPTVSQSLYLRMDDLERALLLLDDLPGVSARARLAPGNEPGTRRLAVDIDEGPLWTGSAWMDNFGNRYIGAERLHAQVRVNNPAGNGDQAMAQASVAEGLRVGRLGYSVPVGYKGARLSGSYTDMTYSVGKELSSLDAEGSGNVISVNLGYPIVRQQRRNVSINLGYERAALRDQRQDMTVSNRRVDAWTLLLEGDASDDFGHGGATRYGARFRFGGVDLSHSAQSLAADLAGPQTHGSYNIAAYHLSRLQRLTPQWSVWARIDGQFADGNLDSYEQFVLGGANGVRGYPAGEGRGDSGWISTVEVRYDLAGNPAWGNWQLVVFFDTGEVELHKNSWAGWNAGNPGLANRYRLSASGVGVNLVKEGSHIVRAMYAQKIGSNPGRSVAGLDADGLEDDGRFWLQAMAYF